MSRMVKLLAVTLVVGALLFGAAFGAASILTINGVDSLGSGSTNLPDPPEVLDVAFVLDDNTVQDPMKVDQVDIEFNEELPVSSDVWVALTHEGTECAWGHTHVTVATYTVRVDVDDVWASAVTDIQIVVSVNH